MSVLREVRHGMESSDEAVAKEEEEQRREQVTRGFEALLKGEPELTQIFRLMCEGVTDPKEVGQKLRMQAAAVIRCRKRLARRAAAFARRNGGPANRRATRQQTKR